MNDSLRGPVAVTTALADLEGKLVGMAHVAPSQTPVSISAESIFYARKGATNAKVPPDEWRAKAEMAPGYVVQSVVSSLPTPTSLPWRSLVSSMLLCQAYNTQWRDTNTERLLNHHFTATCLQGGL